MLQRPEPSAGIAAYDLERSLCLAADSRRADNWARYQAGKRHIDPDYLPVKLDIENVSRCNFKCTMCAVAGWKNGKRAEDMSLECFKRLIDEQYGLVEIKLNGLGEALMQGDDYFEMIRYARERHIWVRMTTNASLLHLRDNYKKLVDSGVNEIDISIDGADAETFEEIRVGGDFERVCANAKLLNDYLREKGKASAKMWTLVQKANHLNLLAHVDLAKQLGFSQLVFSLQMHGWGSDKLAIRNAREMAQPSRIQLEILQWSGHEDVRVSFWDVNAKFDRENLCPWPFSRAVVTSDLRTVPCCMIGDPDKFEIKDPEDNQNPIFRNMPREYTAGKKTIVIGSTPFMRAWTSDEYRAFRTAHVTGNPPKVCKACYA